MSSSRRDPPVDNQLMAESSPPPLPDGAYDHVLGATLPRLELPSTIGRELDVCDAGASFTVLFLYPMTGTPGRPLPEGWMEIPGAFGCTAHSCAYRDHLSEFEELDASVRGISTQSPEEQMEFSTRERIPYPLFSDADLRLKQAMRLPTFDAGGKERFKRASLIIHGRRITRILYPITDPAANAGETLAVVRQLASTP
jgi:peroxiredoxin